MQGIAKNQAKRIPMPDSLCDHAYALQGKKNVQGIAMPNLARSYAG